MFDAFSFWLFCFCYYYYSLVVYDMIYMYAFTTIFEMRMHLLAIQLY